MQLVGVDEADLDAGRINWQSPVARSLMKARAGDEVELRGAGTRETLDVIAVRYIVEAE